MSQPNPLFDQAGHTVLIADDHPLVRGALAQAVRQSLGVSEILEAGDYRQCRDVLGGRPQIDLVLLDLDMPGMNGFEGLVSLRKDYPGVPVVIVSAAREPETMLQVVELGASGFLPKSASLEVIGEALRTVVGGEVWLPAEAHHAHLDGGAKDITERLAKLSAQQLRVLSLICDGKLNKQIAFELAIGEQTVKDHITEIFRKLGVATRVQAAMLARRFMRAER
ncbi:MAG TPA: response regulator transcription factor [Verrucomicrobiae bacterium]|nr:response regulator transcription factor [Verrucomicrobiae bacterium]